MNTAKKLVEQTEIKKQHRVTTRKKVLKKKKSLYNFGNIMTFLCVGGFLVIVGQLFLDAQINQIHYETENLKLRIGTQTVMNEELYSKIAELSTYTRAMEIANQNGLSTYENIIHIGE